MGVWTKKADKTVPAVSTKSPEERFFDLSEEKQSFIRSGSMGQDEAEDSSKWETVDLKQSVTINGVKFGPGKGVEVPKDSWHVYKNAME